MRKISRDPGALGLIQGPPRRRDVPAVRSFEGDGAQAPEAADAGQPAGAGSGRGGAEDDEALLVSRTLMDAPLPPRSLRGQDDEAFIASGRSHVKWIAKLCGLEPHHAVLDIGSGAGRLALALAEFLDSEAGGSYWGTDVNRARIEWCVENVTPRFPNVQFLHVDLHSPYFNPGGAVEPSEYKHPFEPGSFELVIFFSVFSNLLPDAVQMYARETARLLSPTGSAFLTAYVWTEETPDELAAGDPRFTFEHDAGQFRHHREDIPEWAVSYPEQYLRETFSKNGLKVTDLRLGAWRREQSQAQDVLIVSRD
jgi:SAM-dependent methyltransferase